MPLVQKTPTARGPSFGVRSRREKASRKPSQAEKGATLARALLAPEPFTPPSMPPPERCLPVRGGRPNPLTGEAAHHTGSRRRIRRAVWPHQRKRRERTHLQIVGTAQFEKRTRLRAQSSRQPGIQLWSPILCQPHLECLDTFSVRKQLSQSDKKKRKQVTLSGHHLSSIEADNSISYRSEMGVE